MRQRNPECLRFLPHHQVQREPFLRHAPRAVGEWIAGLALPFVLWGLLILVEAL